MTLSRLRYLALAGWLLLAACGQSEAERLGIEDGEADPLVYEIVSPRGETEGWLLGTIHALPDGVDWRSDAVETSVSRADLLMVEVADIEAQAEIARTFSQLATTVGSGPLDQRVSPELRSPLAEMITRSETSPGDFVDIETWGAAVMLARVDASGEPRNGVDRAVIRDFAGREVRGLETAAQQLGAFDTLAEEDQRALLEGTIREWMEMREQPGSLIRAWATGDREAMEAATTRGIMADPEVRAAVLVDRNRRWMPQVLTVLRGSERPLIAVGAAHIIGPDGLPAMLAAHGYRVRRLD